MNIGNIRSLFKLFSGAEADVTLEPVIDLSVFEVDRMILRDADRNDRRLDFLAAAIANLRYQQACASHVQSDSLYEGSLSVYDKNRIIALSFAEKMVEEYMALCHNLISSQSFVFMSFGSEEADSDA